MIKISLPCFSKMTLETIVIKVLFKKNQISVKLKTKNIKRIFSSKCLFENESVFYQLAVLRTAATLCSPERIMCTLCALHGMFKMLETKFYIQNFLLFENHSLKKFKVSQNPRRHVLPKLSLLSEYL